MNSEASSHRVTTKEELDHVLSAAEYEIPGNIELLEICMDQMDVPWRLKDQIAIVNARIQAKKTSRAKLANGHGHGHGEVVSCRNGNETNRASENEDWQFHLNSALC